MIKLDKNKLLGFNIISTTQDAYDPHISAKISLAPPPPPPVITNPEQIVTTGGQNNNGGTVIDFITNSDNDGNTGGIFTLAMRAYRLKGENANYLFSLLNGDYSKNVWGLLLAGTGSINGNSVVSETNYDSAGLIVGTDIFNLASKLKVGAFGAYTRVDSKAKMLSNNHSETDFTQVGLYGSNNIQNNWLVSWVVSTGWGDVDTTRNTNTGLAKGNYNINGYFGDVELLYNTLLRFTHNNATVSPFARIEAGVSNRDSYTETGSGALAVRSEDVSKFTTVLGVRATANVRADSVLVTPSARMGWAHQFADQVAGLTTRSSFVTTTTPIQQAQKINRDSLRVSLDSFVTTQKYKNTGALYISYRNDVATNASNHLGAVGLNVKLD